MSIGEAQGGAGPEQDPEEHRAGKKWMVTLVGLIAVFIVLAVYGLITRGTGTNDNSAARTVPTLPARTPAASAPAAAPTPAHSPITSAAPVPVYSSKSPASKPTQGPLTVVAVAAFGPDGTSDGDNPGIASRVLTGGTQPWYSSWYTTPEFGNLQSGTGLLLNMGDTVTVSSVQLVLGSTPGADVQVRVGGGETLADLTAVANASDVGGTVRLPVTARASGRYVLIWFTRLPPNSQGNYQISVYSAAVDGATGA